ncbi:hypothetical protein TNCV_2241121 [Trichonephila clavipes]|nr:hypothetical protein TNCV_2241121 [Trichonephila clavipes]
MEVRRGGAAQVTSSSLDLCLKLRGPSPIALVQLDKLELALIRGCDIQSDYSHELIHLSIESWSLRCVVKRGY